MLVDTHSVVFVGNTICCDQIITDCCAPVGNQPAKCCFNSEGCYEGCSGPGDALDLDPEVFLKGGHKEHDGEQ